MIRKKLYILWKKNHQKRYNKTNQTLLTIFFSWYLFVEQKCKHILKTLIIPHATSCGGYNVFDPFVSQSVRLSISPSVLLFLSAQLLWISWNFVVIKDVMCTCAYPQEILIQFFFSELQLFWTYKFGQNERYYSKQLLLWNRSTEFPETL